MWQSSPDPQVQRFASLEQELDDLYGDLGLPKPQFGELTVRRLTAVAADDEQRTTGTLRARLRRRAL